MKNENRPYSIPIAALSSRGHRANEAAEMMRDVTQVIQQYREREAKLRRPRQKTWMSALFPAMQKSVGAFGGHVSIQRSPPCWVESAFVEKSVKYLKGLN